MIYLYGLTGPLSEQVQGTGLLDAPLRSLVACNLTAVYSHHEHLELRADPDFYWAHEAAVEAVMRSQTVLPARFGTTFEDTDELRAAIVGSGPALAQRLIELDGCVELAVRINPLPPEEWTSGNGRDYLLAKLSLQRRREALAEGTLACLKELAVASKLAARSSPGDHQMSISYLVRATEVDRFVHAVERLARRWPEFALSCTGPWAPYSFAAAPAQVPREPAGEALPKLAIERVLAEAV